MYRLNENDVRCLKKAATVALFSYSGGGGGGGGESDRGQDFDVVPANCYLSWRARDATAHTARILYARRKQPLTGKAKC